MMDLYRMSADPNPRTILRKDEVLRRSALKTTRLYELIKEGEFPAQVSIGARAVGWYEDEVQTWIDNRPAVEGRIGQSGKGMKSARPDKRGQAEPQNRMEKELTTAVETSHRDVHGQSQKAQSACRRTKDAAGGRSATVAVDGSELEVLKQMSVENSKLKLMVADLMLENEALRSALAGKSAA